MTDKEAQLKAKLLKMKLAESDYQTRNRLDKAKSPMSKEVPFGKDKRKKSEIRDDVLDKTISEAKGTKIRPKTPTQADRARIITAKAKVNKLKTAIVKSPDKYKVPREMKHTRVDSDGPLVNKVPFGEEDRETKQQGMDRIMRDSSYDVKNKKVRPPTPTQADRKRIITAQEHHHKISFRGHKIGGFKGASLNGQSGKYAKYWLLNAKETNGNGWGIAAHTAKENMKKFIGRPLVVTAQSWHGASEYGDEYEHPYLPTNDINAILNHQEKFRVGSIVDVFEDKHGDWYASIEMLPKFASSRLPPFCSPAIYQLDASEAEGQISKWEALHLAALTENPAYGARIALLKGTCVGTDNECKVQFKAAKQEPGIECPIKEKQKKVKAKLSKLKKKQKIAGRFDKAERLDKVRELKKTFPTIDSESKQGMEQDDKEEKYIATGKPIRPKKPTQKDRKRIIQAKLRLANLGEQNMTYQDSKKVKIHKKKHPEVRKAKDDPLDNWDDALRSIGRSVDGLHAQSSFLSEKGDFIGGSDQMTHLHQLVGFGQKMPETLQDQDDFVTNFSAENKLPRVQNFPINKEGIKKTSIGIHSKLNKNQLRSIQDIEKSGREVGFGIGPDYRHITTGTGTRDMMKALRENKFLG
jgi:hypothetical protein